MLQLHYARNEDGPYSDLELNAFVRRMPIGKRIGAMGRVFDGMMIELLWMTRETYLEELDVTEDWYIAGSDMLFAVHKNGVYWLWHVSGTRDYVILQKADGHDLESLTVQLVSLLNYNPWQVWIQAVKKEYAGQN